MDTDFLLESRVYGLDALFSRNIGLALLVLANALQTICAFF